ncbi:MAG: DUF922 domain-containing protein [Chitinophagaceae bacterium]
MLLGILLSALLFFPAIIQGDENTIQWKAFPRLSWNDFKASPPPNATNAALTSSGILMKFSSNGESLTYQISCNFVKINSWGRVKNDHILSHEQGHFDIAEIFARKLNKDLKAYQVNGNSVSKDVNTIYKNVMAGLLEMQTLYDGQTDHSRDHTQQKIWLERINGNLAALDNYSGYTYTSN